MARTPMMAASSTLVLALACFRQQASAFVAPPPTGGVVMHRLLLQHRIEQPTGGVERRSAQLQRLSMAVASGGDVSGRSGGEVGRNSGDGAASSGSSSGGGARGGGRQGASTRLEFGVGLGAAAAAVVLGGTTAAAVAEDISTANADAATSAAITAAVTEGAAEEATAAAATPEVATATAAAAPAPAGARPLLRDLGFEVPYTGKSLPLSKFLGSGATLVVNPKIDDPESLHQVTRRVTQAVPCALCLVYFLLVCAFVVLGMLLPPTTYCCAVRCPRSAVLAVCCTAVRCPHSADWLCVVLL